MASPLEGIFVLDLTRLAPGPFSTMILGDLGADVLRIEEASPPTGRRAEQARGTASAPPGDLLDRNTPFNVLHRNKRSLGLNLKNDRGREVFYQLAKRADVLVEEFRPGVTMRLGIDYETIRHLNSRIVYCSISGYGQDGPYRDLAGHDINYLSLAGLLNMVGPKDGPPAIPQNFIADFAGGGLHATIAILAALCARQSNNEGQYIDISMTDSVVYLQSYLLSMYLDTGNVPQRGATRFSGKYPFYNVYETGDGKYISIACGEPWFWSNLCHALGTEEFVSQQFASGGQRDLIFKTFREVFLRMSRDEWFEVLRKAEVCVGKVYAYDELVNDPQVRHREMIVEMAHPERGLVRQVGNPFKMSGSVPKVRRFNPTMGENTDEVLAELGYSSDDTASLRRSGVIK